MQRRRRWRHQKWAVPCAALVGLSDEIKRTAFHRRAARSSRWVLWVIYNDGMNRNKRECQPVYWHSASGGVCKRRGGRRTGREGEGSEKPRGEEEEEWSRVSGGWGGAEGMRIEQVCRGEIRVLQVSLQDGYIDLRGSKTKRCAGSFITGSRRVNIVSNAACALHYEAIIPNTCPDTHTHTHSISEYNEVLLLCSSSFYPTQKSFHSFFINSMK